MSPPPEELLQVQNALSGILDGDFSTTASRLIALLGYQSDRIPPDQTGHAADFIKQFAIDPPGTKTENEFLDHDPTVQVLSQVTDSEIGLASQARLIGNEFDPGNVRSFVFAAVDLKGDSYPRGKYAQFAREVNKRMSQPTVVLFRTTGGKLTIAFMKRRPDKRDNKRDVLGKVSLIREIDTQSPHPAHVRIVADLALEERLEWMKSRNKHPNFEGLLEAWLDTLDIEALNKQFYKELFAWFEHAVGEARFPTTENPSREEHVIRLITRLLFIWFIKEKQLVNADLFNETTAERVLTDYDQETGDSYYRAILQNLFFATLNTEIGHRGFNHTQSDSDFSQYRYRDEIADPDRLLDLFAETPFINGGLFDCLDSPTNGLLIDCFSDDRQDQGLLSIPNRLFFGQTGLIDLFGRYWFTVEENTPIEQDVALDPELLGRVFENLLAAFNPETEENARNRSGSFYTPRQVVDYMVTEALIAHWKETVTPADGDPDWWELRLRDLLDYADDGTDEISDAHEFFQQAERQALIRNIANIKTVDPAVGSGAFPMAILHRLILVLQRLDTDNSQWQQIQEEIAAEQASRAFQTADQHERDKHLLQISDTFQRYRSDFGRKLYLIQNSIYGVDIQPIACQIAKLRVFISLAIEQEPNSDPGDNYGIRPLPNLETRFVAADTLIGLKGQRGLDYPLLWQLDEDLRSNREMHFHAVTPQHKQEISAADAALRTQLATALQSGGMAPDQARKVAKWNPYDQNASADWFDTKHMFNITDGFDIVIGNPPYIQLQEEGGRLGNKYRNAGYTTFAQSGDIYVLFYEKGCQLLKPAQGMLAYITSNSWMKTLYGKKLRRYLTEQYTPLRLLEMGKDVFNAVVDTNILLVREGGAGSPFPAVDHDAHSQVEDFPPPLKQWGRITPEGVAPWSILSTVEQRVLHKMKAKGTPLSQWPLSINYGIKTGYNAAFIIDKATRDALVAEDPNSDEVIKPILRGRDVKRYRANWANLYLIATHNGYNDIPAVDIDRYHSVKRHLQASYSRLARRSDQGETPYHLRSCTYYGEFLKEKLFWMQMAPVARFAYSASAMWCNQKAFVITGQSLKYLCAVLNSSLATWFVNHRAVTTGEGLPQWDKFVVVEIPVPKVPSQEQHPFDQVIDRILEAKSTNPPSDISHFEAQIDRMVYDLYGLTAEEIEAVEAQLPV